MNDLLTYTTDGVKKTASAGNDDVEIRSRTEGARTVVEVTARRDLTLCEYVVPNVHTVAPADTIFLNGYQSWTDTKERTLTEKEHDVTRLPRFVVNSLALDKYGDAAFYPYDKNKLHGYDLFYTRGEREVFFLNDNVKTADLVFEVARDSGSVSLRSLLDGLRLSAGETCTVCAYFRAQSVAEGLALFAERYPAKPVKKIFGYTSWYNYYQHINEETMLRDLEGLDERFNLFQIDDGYAARVGDWLSVDTEKFPNGLAPVLRRIHEKGLLAGLWLSPFVAQKDSELVAAHKDWLLCDEAGAPILCGHSWGGFYALDPANKEALAYAEQSLRHYADMGFDFFKLDFLYAASVRPMPGKTRAQTAEWVYDFIRRVLPDKLILACGALPFHCAEKFDYLRIGTDVSLNFKGAFYMRPLHREHVSTQNSLQNTVYRSVFDGHLFGNDPDVFLLRDDNIALTKEQRRALVTLNALFGSVLMTSDNVGAYDDEKRALLAEALDLFWHAAVERYARRGDDIEIVYTHHGAAKTVIYDTERGILK